MQFFSYAKILVKNVKLLYIKNINIGVFMEIRIIKNNEFEETCELMARASRQAFSPYYPENEVERIIESLSVERMKKRAEWTHFYVAKEDEKIIGCGAIGPYWGSETESSLFNIFVDPKHQNKGVGKQIIQTLEADEFARRAERIEIPASIPAIPFYKKMGYKFKNNEMLFKDGHFSLEKFMK